MDDVALTGSLAIGDADGLLAVFDAYGHRLHAYAAFLLGDTEAAGDAVLDALLVAAGAAGGLADPARLRPWLYALTRNECLRRRPPGGQPGAVGAAEAVELADRHRMAPADVGAVLGLPAEDAPGLPRHRPAADSPGAPLGAGAGAGAAADEPLTEPLIEPPTQPLAGLLPGAAGSPLVPAYVAANGPLPVGGDPRLPADVAGGGTEMSWHQAETGAEDGAAAVSGGPVSARLRAAVAAGAGPDAAARRAELTRRARPFEPDGFPVPLDRRRLSGAVLAWSVAAVVLLALGMLVVLPVGGGDPVAAAPVGSVLAGAGAPAAAMDETQPVPTLAASPFAVEVQPDQAGTNASRPPPALDRGVERGPATSPRGAPGDGRDAPSPTAPEPGGNRDRVPTTALSVSWSPRADLGCDDGWTAEVRARPYGPGADGVTGVQAIVTGAGGQWTAALRLDGDEWRGQVPGLPTDRPLTLTVRAATADGTTIETSRRLAFSCG